MFDINMIHHSFIKKAEPLASRNWFETGGNAEYFCEPHSKEEYITAVNYATKHTIPLTLLGSGANVLISDKGIKGLVISPKLLDISLNDNDTQPGETVFVTVGSGVTLETLINWCLANNIIGLEEFSGIPGTIGGSLYINIHYFKFLISQFLHNATIIHKKSAIIETVETKWFQFGYNTSKLMEKKHFIVEATFALKKCTPEEAAYARGRSHEIIRHRRQRYPNKGTCGSFFRNFYESEVTLEQNGRKIIFAGYYLDQVGVKGSLSHGKAGVSHQHANMIVNFGGATSSDIIYVIRIMQELVFKKFGLLLKPECELLGFSEYPLHTIDSIKKN